MNKKISFLLLVGLVVSVISFGTYISNTVAQQGGEEDTGGSTGLGGEGGSGSSEEGSGSSGSSGEPTGGSSGEGSEGPGSSPSTPSSGSGYLFGWAWGGTNEGMPPAVSPQSGVGWIKFNSCNDLSPRDGQPDAGCTPTFAVMADMNNGKLSGHAWSSNLGWISFDRSETGSPPSDDPGGGVIARINMSSGSQSGQVTGWARALSAIADDTDGWDGWIHLSDNNSSPSRHPSGGPGAFTGSGGVTYIPSAGIIVGHAWGAQVLGWIKFVAVTLGAPTAAFDYSLSNSGNIQIPKGSQGQSTITRNYVSGTSEPVSISIASPAITGVTATLGSNNPCTPYCSSNITFLVGANAVPNTYNVTVRGVSTVTAVEEFTNFNLTVTEPTPGDLEISCDVDSEPPYLINKTVIWKAEVLGSGPQSGNPPYSAEWELVSENEGTANIPSSGYQESPIFTIDRTYPKIGMKTAMATITDSSIPPRIGVCENAAEINVTVDTNIIEN